MSAHYQKTLWEREVSVVTRPQPILVMYWKWNVMKWMNPDATGRRRRWFLLHLRPLAILTSAGTGNISIRTPPFLECSNASCCCLVDRTYHTVHFDLWGTLSRRKLMFLNRKGGSKKIIKYILQANQYYAMCCNTINMFLNEPETVWQMM